jgi:hypothetical protein
MRTFFRYIFLYLFQVVIGFYDLYFLISYISLTNLVIWVYFFLCCHIFLYSWLYYRSPLFA